MKKERQFQEVLQIVIIWVNYCNNSNIIEVDEEEIDLSEESVIKILNKADTIIRKANILDSEYINRFDNVNSYTKRPKLAVKRINEYLKQIEIEQEKVVTVEDKNHLTYTSNFSG